MSALPKSAKANPDGREGNGRFARGNKGGPGNPYARQVAELRRAVVQTMTPDDLREIIVALMFRAKAGNVSAAKLLLQYGLGTPIDSAHPDRLDADEVEAFKANALGRDAIAAVESTPVGPALVALRDLLPARGEQFLAELRGDIAAAVSKREKPPTAASAFAEAETMRLIPPTGNGRS
jgi:hypothetical protein